MILSCVLKVLKGVCYSLAVCLYFVAFCAKINTHREVFLRFA